MNKTQLSITLTDDALDAAKRHAEARKESLSAAISELLLLADYLIETDKIDIQKPIYTWGKIS
jgi:hypothetical protein